MIVVQLKGGMGNQMFQYAAAKALALKHHTSVYLDQSFLEVDAQGMWTQRSYGLRKFRLDCNLENYKRSSLFRRIIRSSRLRRIFLPGMKVYKELNSRYDLSFEKCSGSVYLDGYFQSEKYFIGCETQIREDFEWVSVAEGKNKVLLDEISSGAYTVSLHIRRGDMVTLPAANAFHGVLPVSYYETAIKYIMENRPGAPEFYVFSDDPEWVRTHLKLPGKCCFVDWNAGENSFEDMRLMSSCKHNIIANSSFSWWSAWLNKNPEKIIVAPARWLNDPASISPDLLPKAWIKL